MQSDTLKLLATYAIAFIVIVGGGAMLYLTRLDPPESNSQNLSLLIAGFIGSAIAFVFNRESATQATRSAQSASSQGAAQATADTGTRSG